MTPDEIRTFRERRLRMTLDELASALDVNRHTVWRWEQPAGSPHHRAAPPFLLRALRDVAREMKR